MSRDQNDTQVLCNESHRIFFAPGQLCQELGVPGKTIAAEEQGALVDWRRGNRIHASGSAEFNRGFDVTGSRSSGGAGFDTGLDESVYVIEVVDYRLGKFFGNRLALTNDI